MFITSEIDKAISAHAFWKARLRLAIDTGKSEWSVRDVSPDYHCDFGKWLHSLPAVDKTSSYWKTVQVLHAEFHLVASQILALALNNKKEEALAAMKIGSKFAEVSARLTNAMTDWKSVNAHSSAAQYKENAA